MNEEHQCAEWRWRRGRRLIAFLNFNDRENRKPAIRDVGSLLYINAILS